MTERVAIVGVGCIFPGAEDSDEFWKVLKNGENHVGEVPKNRWNSDAFYDSDASKPGKTNVRKAGFVTGYEKWDYKFHEINKFESERMDPQHKLVLDSTYMALENAGITKKDIKGSNTGVYIGVMNGDYSGMTSTSSDFNNYTVTGTNNSIVSSRVNYAFDLRGPSMSIDTACSSSLIAIHQGTQSILSGECDQAIAGGVNLILSPNIFIQLTKAGMASPTGQCQAFSENADGYARGEGCGIVILKSYQKAIEDNNPIWATISTASNHDGHTVTPITTPSMEQQIQLLDIIFSRYDVDPQSIDYIEAHGTGTKAGDPVEVNALGRFFQTADNSTPKLLGSVKTNIGHLESAAGVAGLLKVLLMHKHQQVVPSLHFKRPAANVPLQQYKFNVPVELQPWPDSNREVLRSSVNCFSFGGSNCHAIVTTQMSKTKQQSYTDINLTHPKVVCLSAVDKISLQKMRDSTCENAKDYKLADLSYTSTIRRNHFLCRLAVSGQNTTEITKKLESIDINKHMAKFNTPKTKKFIFVFGGLGTIWKGMCKEMLNRFSVFRSTIDAISLLLRQYVTWDLSDCLKEGFQEEDAFVGPIMTFACEVALFDLLKSFGVHPNAIIGQSIGEVAAAFASEAVTLEQAVYIIYHRTRVQVQGIGGKMFVANNIEIVTVEEVLKQYESKANVAVYSSPMGCTISCDANIANKLKEDILQVNTGCILTDLNVTSAFHSHHMDISSEEMKTCTEIIGEEPKIDTYSTVSGIKAEKGDYITPQYWADNIRKPVKLYQAVHEAYDRSKYNIFVEVGPRPILRAHLPNIFPDQALIDSIPLMKRGDELICITEAVCNLYNHGVDLQWRNFDDFIANVVDYPKYKFNRVDNIFIPIAARQKLMGMDQKFQNHPCVKKPSSDTDYIKLVIDPDKLGSVYEHRVDGLVVIPGALYAEAGLALVALRSPCIAFREVTVDFVHPLIISNREDKQLDILVEEVNVNQIYFRVFEGPNTYSSGFISTCFNKPVPIIDIEGIRNRCNFEKTGKQIYDDLSKFEFTYGEAMSVLQGSKGNEREALIELEINNHLREEMDGMILHPAIIDSMLQAPGAFAISETFHTLPVQLKNLRVYSEVQRKMLIYIQLKTTSKTKLLFNVMLCSETGTPIAGIETFTAQIIDNQRGKPQKMFFEPNWFLISENMCMENPLIVKYVSVSVESRPSHDNEKNVVVPLVDNGKVLNMLKELLRNYTYVVIFINVGYNEKCDGIEIQKTITDYFSWLKDVLKCIDEVKGIDRILINLSNTWTIDEMNTNPTQMTPDNIIQSALWGGLRSVQREVTSSAIHILDLHNNKSQTDSELLLIILGKLASDWQHHGELVFTEKSVFGYQILYMAESESKSYRTIADTGHVDFELFSTSQDMVKEKDVFKLYTRSGSLQIQPDTLLLNVTKLVLHEASLFPLVADQEDHDDGWPIYCLETVGYQSHEEKDLIVSCFPVLAANKIVVPSSCCIPLSSVPFYTPGLLSLLISFWTLTSNLHTKNIIILHQESSFAYLLHLILKYKKVSSRLLNPKELSSDMEEREIICLMPIDKLLADIITKNDSIHSVISFSSLLPVKIAAILRRRQRILNVRMVYEHDMFSQPNISTIIQDISKWLTDLTNRDMIDRNHFDFSKDSRDALQILFKSKLINLNSSVLSIPLRLTSSRLFSKFSAYIVVGGLTGLGWQCVKFLATHHAGYILIFNRRKPNKDNVSSIETLSSSASCTIKCYSVDVVDFGCVKETIQNFRSAYVDIPIKGVLYGAGVLRDSHLFNMTQKQITECFNPKILGAWNLHQATMDLNLDFFILHSSITVILGAFGQSNYGVGNAFQDSLIALRRKSNLPIQTLNWGPLNMGMLEKDEGHDRTREELFRMGYEFIDKEEIGLCLEKIILSTTNQFMITKFDSQKLTDADFDQFTKRRLYHILTKTNTEQMDSSVHVSFDLQSLKNASSEQISQIIEDYINRLVKMILQISEVTISPETVLVDAGMDSMLAMTLMNQVKKDFHVKVPLNLLFGQETTVLILSKFIEDEFKGGDIFDLASDNQIGVPHDSTISYPELRYLHLNNLQTYKAYHHMCDLVFDNLPLKREEVIMFIKTMMKRYPICTAVFKWKEGLKPERSDVTKTLLDIESAMDICEVDPNDPDIENIFKKRYFDKFDVRTKGPVRFTFAVHIDKIRLSIVFNHVGFDMESVNLFVRDIVVWVQHWQRNMPLENFQTPTEHRQLVGQILDIELAKEEPGLRKFWTSQLEKGVPHVTLDIYRTFSPKPGNACVSEYLLPLETQELCESLSKSFGTTTNNLFMTIYQLLLGTRSKTERVVINTTVNLRPQTSELMERVECISNHVPIFADMPLPTTTFTNFLQANSAFIFKTLEHGMFPYTEIIKLIPEGQNKDLDRHEMVVQDFTFVDDVSQVADAANLGLKVSGENTYTGIESVIKVLRKGETTTFRLMLGGTDYNQQDADVFLREFIFMLRYVTTNPSVTIQQLQDTPQFTDERKSQSNNDTVS